MSLVITAMSLVLEVSLISDVYRRANTTWTTMHAHSRRRPVLSRCITSPRCPRHDDIRLTIPLDHNPRLRFCIRRQQHGSHQGDCSDKFSNHAFHPSYPLLIPIHQEGTRGHPRAPNTTSCLRILEEIRITPFECPPITIGWADHLLRTERCLVHMQTSCCVW